MRRAAAVLAALAAIFGALFVSHFPFLRLPFYWDELGQFVPAALDIYNRGAWVPYTTIPNVHPPGVMAYLASLWRCFGYSILATRAAMLVLAAAGLLITWHLTRRLTGRRGVAWLASLFLFCSPLFFSQSMMAQLDMPAMTLTALAFLLFFGERYVLCALVCVLAVIAKETAILIPALFGFLLLRRGSRSAFWFVLPLIPLLFWLAVIKRSTGHWFGDPAFTQYNLFYPLHPVRLTLALLRRSYYLLVGSGHAIGAIALYVLLHRRRWRLPWEWQVIGAFALLHVVLITVLGGAVLERYLLPVLPFLYAVFAWALLEIRGRVGRLLATALTACLLTACVVNPPYPFPMENNLAWTTFVTLHREVAQFAEAAIPNANIATSFPLAGALRRPEMGYVSRPLRVLEISDFREATLAGEVRNKADALIEFQTFWDPKGLLQNPTWIALLKRFYGYVPQVPPSEVPRVTGMRSLLRTCAAGQCVEVFRK